MERCEDMDERDLRKIPETAYLTAENAARYRAVLHFCYQCHEHMQSYVYPEEILRHLKETDFFQTYTAEQLDQDLGQLVDWHNLTQHQETTRARSIADFKRKKFRYQCTPYTVEIERMVERLRSIGDSFGGSLESTQFDRLLGQMEAFLERGENLSDEELHQTWEDLMHYFRTLVENASDYLAHLRSAKVEERMQTSAFLAYKDMCTKYLRSFVLGLQKMALRATELIERAEKQDGLLDRLFDRLSRRQEFLHLMDEHHERASFERDIRADWDALRVWFLGTDYRQSELHVLEDETIETIRRITRFAQRIAEEHQMQRSRKQDYLYLAERFLACEDKREADGLASVVFGVSGVRHFFAPADADHENIHRHVEDVPPAEIELSRRVRGGGVRRHRSVIRERGMEKAQALREYREKQRKMQEMLDSLMVDGSIDFGHLPKITAPLRRNLLTWVDRCLSKEDRTVALSSGRRMHLVWEPGNAERVCVHADDGDFWMPAMRLVFDGEGGREGED